VCCGEQSETAFRQHSRDRAGNTSGTCWEAATAPRRTHQRLTCSPHCDSAARAQSACSTERVHAALATALPLVPGLTYFRFCAADARCGIALDEIDPEQVGNAPRQIISAQLAPALWLLPRWPLPASLPSPLRRRARHRKTYKDLAAFLFFLDQDHAAIGACAHASTPPEKLGQGLRPSLHSSASATIGARSCRRARRRGGQWAQLEAATDEYIARVDAELAAAAALLSAGRDLPAADPAGLRLGATLGDACAAWPRSYPCCMCASLFRY